MTNYKKRLASFAVFVFVAASGAGAKHYAQATGLKADAGKYPVFELDTTWPPPLPNQWVFGLVSKISVDQHDNVWIIHRPRSVPPEKTSAPPVVEFDATGKFVQAWGGDGAGYDWPGNEHNIFVDHKDRVWISGTAAGARGDDMILEFTTDGKFVKELGGRNTTHGNKDTVNVNRPGDLWVSPKTDELYVADGYGNSRVIVYDAETLAFKRMWGAFGKPPQEGFNTGNSGEPGEAPTGGRTRGAAPALDTEGPGSPTFASPVHSVLVSNDDIVYVCDRSNRRVQLFTPDGKYLMQFFLNRAGPAGGSAVGLAFSRDKEQRFLYVGDYGNSHIAVVDRKKLDILYQFGKRGPEPGNFQGTHHIATDSKGNLYVAEVAPGARAQRFLLKGTSSMVPPNALTAADLDPKPPKP